MANTIKIKLYREDDEGEYDEDVELPATWVICERCEGDGHHSNPSIDGNGITSSEWAEWDEDERETYMSGGYDVPCVECGGAGKLLVVDREKVDKAVLKELDEQARSQAESRANDRYWQRLESGGGEY